MGWRRIEEGEEGRVEDFLESQSRVSPFFFPQFRKSITESYPEMVMEDVGLMEGGRIVGLVPGVVCDDVFFSQPFTDSGGYVGREVKDMNGKAWKFRGRKFVVNDRTNFLTVGKYSAKGQLLVPIEKEEEVQWNSLEKRARTDIRFAEKHNVNVRAGDLTDVAEFHRRYERLMRGWGVPFHSVGFFERLMVNFGKRARFLVAEKDGAVGWLFLLFGKNEGAVAYQVSTEEGYRVKAGDLLYWDAIRRCRDQKMAFLDLGQGDLHAEKGSREEGLSKYKGKFHKDIVFLRKYRSWEAVEGRGWIRKIWKVLPLWILRRVSPVAFRKVYFSP